MSNSGGGNPLLGPPVDEPDYKQLLRNPISLIGLALAAVAIANIIFLFILDITTKTPSPYIGIFAYMIMPGVMMLGMALVPVGIAFKRNRLRKNMPLPKFPRLDFNNPSQRSTFAFFLSFVVIFMVVSAVGSYRAYEFTDSTQFCGKLCHVVMHPEYTAHQASPHARVGCVDCHVGHRSRMVCSLQDERHPPGFQGRARNLPTPDRQARLRIFVLHRKPASNVTGPRKFWGAQLKVINHFGYDEKSTPRQLRLLIKTGGGDPNEGQASGIHWHMNIANDHQLRLRSKTSGHPLREDSGWQGKRHRVLRPNADPAQIAKMTTKKMDCVDCHNRPTHIYMPPDRSVDQSLAARRIDPSLAVHQAAGCHDSDLPTTRLDEAVKAIATKIPEYYARDYPERSEDQGTRIQSEGLRTATHLHAVRSSRK